MALDKTFCCKENECARNCFCHTNVPRLHYGGLRILGPTACRSLCQLLASSSLVVNLTCSFSLFLEEQTKASMASQGLLASNTLLQEQAQLQVRVIILGKFSFTLHLNQNF